MARRIVVSLIVLTALVTLADAQSSRWRSEDTLKTSMLGGLKFRNLGPAIISGRVQEFAVNPNDRADYYVAVASSGVWRTTNAGTTWSPVFESEGSYSVGTVALDPSNPHTVWVGTGEAQSQRSVGYGDGLYRSTDGGKSWKHMGLKNSEHIADILFDPRDAKVMYVSAQGPLWSAGGDRGLFKSTDAGTTWNCVLKISENTGVTSVVLDPRDPDVLYAASYQRRRHRWSMINGGPESAIHKSTDAGKTWAKLSSGLPSIDMGKIGLAISPVNPDILYATIEAEGDAGGIFRSTDRGATWEKRNPFIDTQMYYGEIMCDPADVDRIYVMATVARVSDDGGKALSVLANQTVHVDFHALWIDPKNPRYYLIGCDGGVYESFDRGALWSYKANLPTVQFYRVAVDNSVPFYFVYGGTQDNATFGGPSRTTSASGIVNSDWFATIGGDGFKTQVDPSDPNIVYSQYQYGGLGRYDRRTGELLDIKPIEGKAEAALRWNWDSPLLVSPHSPSRLYFGANRLFRSDDRGVTWTPVSGDLTRQLDRNTLPIMGTVWHVDAINKHGNTALFGNLTYISESPKQEGLLYIGTDDGLIQVSEDGGRTWRKLEKFPGVPEMTYVSSVHASLFDVNTVYATFDNHQNGDFKPYVLRSTDKGKSWTSLTANLPERGNVRSFAQDHVDTGLLFVGTEFGLHFTVDGGRRWVQVKGGLPTIPVMDIEIQRRENDLVLATFGRGFYVLDDYTPLRELSSERVTTEASILPVKDALMYVESTPMGGSGKSHLGDGFYLAENPPFGATITYYLKKEYKSAKQLRKQAEKEAAKSGKTVSYPTFDALRAETDEEAPLVILTIKDDKGTVVRRLKGNNAEGLNRVAWNLRGSAVDPFGRGGNEWDRASWMVMPGTYSVTLSKRLDGAETVIAGPLNFVARRLGTPSIVREEESATIAFQDRVVKLQRAALGTAQAIGELTTRVGAIQAALQHVPAASGGLYERARVLERKLIELRRAMSGDEVIAKYNEPVPPSIMDRVNAMVSGFWGSTAGATTTMREAYRIAAAEFRPTLDAVRTIAREDLPALERDLSTLGAPWTPGRIPEWTNE